MNKTYPRLRNLVILTLIMGFIFSLSSLYGQENYFVGEAQQQERTYPVKGGHVFNRDASYIIDDGTSDNAVALSSGGDFMWLNAFTVVPGAEYISSISLAWGWTGGSNPVPVGAPTRVILYEDPNDDGDPSDAVYLTEVTTYVANPNTDIFTTVPLYAPGVDPIMVTGVFFIAALYQNQPALPSYYPAPLDQSSDASASWLVGSSTFGGFDVYNLTAAVNDVSLQSNASANLPGNWLLRAHGLTTPPAVPLASVWIVIAVAGMGIAAFFKFRRK